MENKIAKREKQAIAVFNFKNAELNKASERIYALKGSIAENMSEIARILGRVKREKLYVEDGFKSVHEYAENALDLGKATAYAMAGVGDRFLLSDTVTSQTVSAMLSPSNLTELVGLTDDEIQDGINKKLITPASTQVELRAYANAVKSRRKDGKVKVLPQFAVDIKIVHNGTVSGILGDKWTLPEAINEITQAIDFSGSIEKQFVNEGKGKDGAYHPGVRIYFNEKTGDIVKMTYERLEKPKPKEQSKPKFTKEQLLAMLAELGE